MKFNKTTIIGLIIIICYILPVEAQFLKPKFGLRAGANLTTMFGPTEEGTTEQHRLSVRVAAGATMKLPFHERFGLAVEVLFVQKGSYYTLEADNSFLKLPDFVSQQGLPYGYDVNGGVYTKRTDKSYKKRMGVNVINGYIEVPIMFYVEAIDDKLEFEFGASIGFLISSQGLGTLKFGPSDVLNDTDPQSTDFIEMDLDYKFIKDEIGEAYDPTARSAKIDGSTRYYPTGPSAYYLTDELAKDGLSRYSLFDVGLQGGVSYYFTKGLRIGARFNYSLMDITTNKYDQSFTELRSNGDYKELDHKDVNFGCQIFVGLQF
jgi:hypothetical protein